MKLLDYLDGISIIHLPSRVDRYESMEKELRYLGISIRDPKVSIPHAPVPEDASGWPSKGVYGNFLSHHGILKEAVEKGLSNVMVLEDDAIFSRRFRDQQEEYVDLLKNTSWDLCFFGHNLRDKLKSKRKGLIPSHDYFNWAHCYVVHQRVLPKLLGYLEEVMTNEAGHPRGGRMYIDGADGAFTYFRRQNPDIITLVANPVLSVQKGGVSDLHDRRWYDSYAVARPLVSRARSFRDECWRRLG
jgi:glycosyl transferase family 25